MKDSIKIIRMQEQHVRGIATLSAQCFSEPWSFDSLFGELSNPHAAVFAAVEDGEVAGFLSTYHILDEGYINNIAVSPAFRRKGVASALMDALFSYALEQSLSFYTLEVRVSNLPAIGFYESMGFVKVGLRKDFYSKPVEDAILYTRYFNPGFGESGTGSF